MELDLTHLVSNSLSFLMAARGTRKWQAADDDESGQNKRTTSRASEGFHRVGYLILNTDSDCVQESHEAHALDENYSEDQYAEP